MNTLPLRILLLAGSASLLSGAQLGIEEAGRTAMLFDVPAPQLIDLNTADRPASSVEITVLIAADPTTCGQLQARTRDARALVIGVGCSPTVVAAQCAPTVFHIAAADSGTVLWDASLEAFGAAQLNERFRQRFGRPMDADAWAGWMAVKAITEAALRTRSSAPDSLRRYLEQPTTRFDGHKGAPLSFGPAHVLTSPVYRIGTPSPMKSQEPAPVRASTCH